MHRLPFIFIEFEFPISRESHVKAKYSLQDLNKTSPQIKAKTVKSDNKAVKKMDWKCLRATLENGYELMKYLGNV